MSGAPRFWKANWVFPGLDPRQELGVFVYRRRVNLEKTPASLKVNVTADQRFRLYVNGVQVGFGPARSDLFHWSYDQIELAPFLSKGENIIHAVVWNFGFLAPMAQHSSRTAFILEGESVATPDGWEVARVEGYDFANLYDHLRPTYYVAGPGEIIDGSLIKGWDRMGSDSGLAWKKVERYWTGRPDGSRLSAPISGGSGKEEGSGVGDSLWHLVPRSIPPMLYQDLHKQPSLVDRKTDERKSWTKIDLKAGEEALLDCSELLTAFPRVTASGSGVLKVRYAEALYEGPNNQKGNRNKTVGKEFSGAEDQFKLTSDSVTFEPLWWRCYRYVLLVADGEVSVSKFQSIETGYPLEDESRWESDGQLHDEIFDVALRTCRRCAGETYFDCPYYEQLQYVGDTRIQAQVGRYLSRDRRLQNQAIKTFADSSLLSGLTQSRAPGREPQVIPSFSLWWIQMLWDQHLYDTEGVDPAHISRAREVLRWWDWAIEDAPEMTYWAFADWVDGWDAGVPPGGLRSVVHTVQLLWTRAIFAKMTDDDALLAECRTRLNDFSETPEGAVVDSKWDPKAPPSEHAMAMLRLAQLEITGSMKPWPSTLPAGAARASLFYSWYCHQARPTEDYEGLLEPWRKQLEDGLTTFIEIPDPTRSDCHAWSSHPILGFYQRIAGVTSGAPGWAEAIIQPNPGQITRFRAEVPHPKGHICVELKDGRVSVVSPVPYKLIWKDKVITG